MCFVLSIVIRKASFEDIPAIYEITKEAFKVYIKKAGITAAVSALTETLDDVRDDVLTKDVFIAVKNNYPVGCVRVTINTDSTAYISRLGVRIKYQRSGIGKTLFDWVNRSLMELGITKVYLYTAAQNSSLLGFYRSLGFYIERFVYDREYPRTLMCKNL